MGRTNEFTLVGSKTTFEGKAGCAVKVGASLVHKTPAGVIATSAGAIDGIITDITITGADEVTLAVAKAGDIAFAKLADAVTVGAELEVGDEGALQTKASGAYVAKALATGAEGELIPVIIK